MCSDQIASAAETGSSGDSPKFLRRLGVLGILTTLTCVVARSPFPRSSLWGEGLFRLLMIIAVVYLAWILLRTRDLVSHPWSLHPLDAWVCRRSGLLTTALATGLLSFAVVTIVSAERKGTEPIWLTNTVVLQTINLLMEIGFVLAVACCSAPSALRHVRPVFLWKAVSGFLCLIYGLYVILIPLSMAVVLRLDDAPS